jgi:5'-nucleotidase
MKILLTNDDGINAPGLQEMYSKLKDEHDVYIFAPEFERSGCSHAISLKTNLYVHNHGEKSHSCTGYPVDCVYLALNEFYKDVEFDLVISGINKDANLAQDHFYSGTVGAAREAVLRGNKAISISLVLNKNKDNIKYETAALLVLDLIKRDIHKKLGTLSVLNINVPNVKYSELQGIKLAALGFRHYSDEVTKLKDDACNDCYQITGSYRGPKTYDGSSDCELIYQSFATATSLKLVNESSIDDKDIKETLHEVTKGLPFTNTN